MARTEEDFAVSRKLRQEFILEYGMVPQSIMKHDRSDMAPDFIVKGGRSYSAASRKFGQKLTNHFEKLNKTVVQITTRFVSRGISLSTFPQNIGRFFVKFYCPEGGMVYDPCAGHNSRMYLVHSCGRNYIGVDVCHEFMEANRAIAEIIKAEDESSFEKNNCTITLYEQSSASVPQVPDNFADYTITSPPYYKQEKYGPEPEQLGNSPTYEGFLELLYDLVKENFRILKPGAYASWFINDFMYEKVYRCYHADLIQLFLKAGFVLHDIVISDLGHAMTSIFVKNLIRNKRLPKRHEYGCTFRKPE